jgi:hypothetical protein
MTIDWQPSKANVEAAPTDDNVEAWEGVIASESIL